MLTAVAGVIFLFTFISAVRRWRSRTDPHNQDNLPLPPGPKGHFLVGNLFQIPKERYWVQLEKWAREFGPIYTIKIFGTPIIVTTTTQAGSDLLEKRSAKYSDRPQWIMANDILTQGMHVGVTRYGERHRKLRKALRDGLHGSAVEAYWPNEELEARLWMEGIAQSPAEFVTHLKRFAASIVLGTTYSHKVKSFSKDPYVSRLFESASEFARTLSPGRHIVDFLPILRQIPRWVPGTSWQDRAAAHAQRDRTLYFEIFDDVKKATEEGDANFCFVSQMLEDPSFGLNDEETAYMAGNLSQAPDTLASVLNVFILAMTVFPEKQRLAQAEIDRVIGRDRLPTLRDRESLPYVNALVKEVLRWRTVAPLGVPHASTAPDVYNGYFIPKGTIVIAFAWAMHRDPEIYPNPDKFMPERHLSSDGKTFQPKPEHTFGFGRRACPGSTLADTAAWIYSACTLWGFDICRKVGHDGKEIIPRIDPEAFSGGGEASRPLPYETDIRPRKGVLQTLRVMRQEHPSHVGDI